MKKTTPETKVTQEIIAELLRRGYTVKKIYNGGVATRYDSRTKQIVYRKKAEMYKGVPDLIAFNAEKRKFFFIEVKSAKGKVKPEQKEFITAFNDCEYFAALVARSRDDIAELV